MTKLGPVPRLDKTVLYINILSISMAEHKVKLPERKEACSKGLLK